MDEFHPGLHNAKAFSLISQRKFEEVPILIKNAKNYAKDVDPYNYIYALANELLMLYYTGVFGIIDDKIAVLKNEFENIMGKLPEESKTRLAVTEAFILGNSVAISLKRREDSDILDVPDGPKEWMAERGKKSGRNNYKDLLKK